MNLNIVYCMSVYEYKHYLLYNVFYERKHNLLYNVCLWT